MARKMPKADKLMKDGKVFDKAEFQKNLPDAIEAVTSGETKLHKIVIWAGDDGKPHMEVQRSHSHKKGGLPAKIAADLSQLLAAYIVDGTVTVGSIAEQGNDTADTLTISAA